MSLIPPPAPPPLPPVNVGKKVPNNLNCSPDGLEEELKILFLQLSSEGKFSLFLSYLPMMPQLQVGPTCGLVALSMALNAINRTQRVEDLFETAVNLGVTKLGEMFSVDYMTALANTVDGVTAQVVGDGLDNHFALMLRVLLDGGALLVPYDADFNHSPCCRRGHSAHWVALSGFIVAQTGDGPGDWERAEIIVPSNSMLEVQDTVLWGGYPVEPANVYFLGRQGKSKHLRLWGLSSLAKSNSNLEEFSPSRDEKEFIIPDGGLPAGLQGKAVLLWPKKPPPKQTT